MKVLNVDGVAGGASCAARLRWLDVALVSEVFVESVQKAAEEMGMTAAFGFILVALVRRWPRRFQPPAKTGWT